jgi:hypothetical protein
MAWLYRDINGRLHKNPPLVFDSMKATCDVCGKFISFNDLCNRDAVHNMVSPDSDYSEETWETLCKRCKR